jgi:hypothetical protein
MAARRWRARSEPANLPGVSDLFVSAYNYCDTHCERCPLRERCAVARTEARRRQEHLARGVDPDAPEVVLEDVLSDVRRAIQQAQATLAELEPDEEGDAPRVVSLTVERLSRLGSQLAMQARRSARALNRRALNREADALRRELLFQSLVIARKCGRLSMHLDVQGRPLALEERWARDGAPNVLLLEEAQRRVRRAIDGLFDEAQREPLERLHGELDRLLVPLRAAVPAEARLALHAMIAAGTAPSPFCVDG